MSDLEDRLADLRPLPAPPGLWERVRRGEPAPARRARLPKDAPLWAAAAALLATLYGVLSWTPDPSPVASPGAAFPQEPSPEILERLRDYPHKILCESNREGNWELYLLGADGSAPVNVTRTPDVDELYPKVSPDGSRVCFAADEGKGEGRVRNLYVMNLDGTDRRKIADNSREPCWNGDGTAVAYLKGEFDTFTHSDFATKGIYLYDLKTGQTREHPNNAKIHHLYTLNWSPDGRWFIATVHGGMGFKHGILAIEAEGTGVFDLGLGGCRPDLSPDGRQIAWGHGDYAVGVGDLDLASRPPKVTNIRNVVQSKEPMETYHADWSPDGKYIAFSFGPKFKGKNLKGLLPEFPGVEAPGWNVCVADVAQKNRFAILTTDGKSNKEPDWVRR
jgi:Tol biopolymer transport system component